MRATQPIIIHYVHDMKRALSFYKTVFDVNANAESPGWSTLDFGAIELALHILGPRDVEAPMPHAGLNLLVADIEEMRDRIHAVGGEMLELREPDGFVPVRVAMFKDCEGNGFELRQEV